MSEVTWVCFCFDIFLSFKMVASLVLLGAPFKYNGLGAASVMVMVGVVGGGEGGRGRGPRGVDMRSIP